MEKVRKLTQWVLVVCLMVALVAVGGCGENKADKDEAENGKTAIEDRSLTVYSGAGLRKPMDEIGQAFEEKTGVKVNFNYAGCAQLLGQMELTQEGDVFVGGSLNDAEIALEKGFIQDYQKAVYHIPAIGVPKGNPAGITCLADMAKPGVKLVLGDAESNAIGKKGEKIFAKNQLQVEQNVVARDATVNEIVTHLAMGQGDAGLIWEDNGFGNQDIEIIAIPEEQNITDMVPVCCLNFSQEPELAQQFVDFIMSEEGMKIFAKHGFKPVKK
jgi:molybdate transport system substrate-binding protein